MKRELTLADVVGYLPHRLVCRHPEGRTTVWAGIKGFHYPEMPDIGKPVLRPTSDLYVEITERGYNNGKPFVPLVELAKVRYPHLASRRFITDAKYVECAENDLSGWEKMYELELEDMSVGEFDLLHRLHFDYRGLIDDGLAINVHDLRTNQYE